MGRGCRTALPPERYYDPDLGRFISADPFRGDLSNPRSLNRYGYSSNDPVNRCDPSGLQDDWGGGLGFDAPVIDTGSSYSGWDLSQGFDGGWGAGQLQFQNSNSGPSIIDLLKSGLSNAFGPVTTPTIALARGIGGFSTEAMQSAGNTGLSGLDFAASTYGGFLRDASLVDTFKHWVQQWFAATDCDDCCPQFDEPVHAAQHYGGWNRLGE